MSDAPTHSIGNEIPYRRSSMEPRTGSLVFDKHLDAKLAERPHSNAERPVSSRDTKASQA